MRSRKEQTMKYQHLILFVVILLAILLAACTVTPTPVEPGSTPVAQVGVTKSPEGENARPVLVLVVDSFSAPPWEADQIAGLIKGHESEYCTTTPDGQVFATRGMTSAGQELPKPHGRMVYEVLQGLLASDGGQKLVSTEGAKAYPGEADWMDSIELWRIPSGDVVLAAIDVPGFLVSEAAQRIQEATKFFQQPRIFDGSSGPYTVQGVQGNVINMSFAIVPCDPTKYLGTPEEQYQIYLDDLERKKAETGKPEEEVNLVGALRRSGQLADASAVTALREDPGQLANLARTLTQPSGGTQYQDALARVGIQTEEQASAWLADPELQDSLLQAATGQWDSLLQLEDALAEVGPAPGEDYQVWLNDPNTLSNLSFFPGLAPSRLNLLYQSVFFREMTDFSTLAGNELFNLLDNPPAGKASTIAVGAAGNSHLDFSFAPALWPQVVSVSSESEGTTISARASYSNSGEVMLDGTYSEKIAGTSFAAPRLAFLAARYLLKNGGTIACNSLPPLAHNSFDNSSLSQAVTDYCSNFPTSFP